MLFPALRRCFLLVLAITFASAAAHSQTSATPALSPSVTDTGLCAGFLAGCLHSVQQVPIGGDPISPGFFPSIYGVLFQLTNTPTDERPFPNLLQVSTADDKLNFRILSWKCTRDDIACKLEVTSANGVYVYRSGERSWVPNGWFVAEVPKQLPLQAYWSYIVFRWVPNGNALEVASWDPKNPFPRPGLPENKIVTRYEPATKSEWYEKIGQLLNPPVVQIKQGVTSATEISSGINATPNLTTAEAQQEPGLATAPQPSEMRKFADWLGAELEEVYYEGKAAGSEYIKGIGWQVKRIRKSGLAITHGILSEYIFTHVDSGSRQKRVQIADLNFERDVIDKDNSNRFERRFGIIRWANDPDLFRAPPVTGVIDLRKHGTGGEGEFAEIKFEPTLIHKNRQYACLESLEALLGAKMEPRGGDGYIVSDLVENGTLALTGARKGKYLVKIGNVSIGSPCEGLGSVRFAIQNKHPVTLEFTNERLSIQPDDEVSAAVGSKATNNRAGSANKPSGAPQSRAERAESAWEALVAAFVAIGVVDVLTRTDPYDIGPPPGENCQKNEVFDRHASLMPGTSLEFPQYTCGGKNVILHRENCYRIEWVCE